MGSGFRFLLMSLALSGAPPLFAQVITAPSATVESGSSVTVTVLADYDLEIGGFSYGLCTTGTGAVGIGDAGLVVPGSDLAAVTPDFFQADVYGNGEHTVGVIISFLGSMSLPPGSDLELVDVTYQGVASGTVDLCFCDTLGIPPTETVFFVGGTFAPIQVCGAIVVEQVCSDIQGLSCEFDSVGQQVVLQWTNPHGYTFHQIYRNGVSLGSISGDDESYVDMAPEAVNSYVVESICVGGETVSSSCSIDLPSAGDVDGDRMVGIGDAIYLLNFLFASGPLPPLFECS